MDLLSLGAEVFLFSKNMSMLRKEGQICMLKLLAMELHLMGLIWLLPVEKAL